MAEETDVPMPAETVVPPEPVKISFGVKKRPETRVVQPNASVAALDSGTRSDEENDEEEERAAKRRKLTHFENGGMPDDDDDKKKTAVVIPMVMEIDWRVQKLLEQEKEGTISDVDRAKLEILIEANPALAAQRAKEKEEQNGSTIVVDTAKEHNEDADYNKVSIESFGLAILRGCGWKDGEGIGKNPQKVALRLPERRPKGLGLGAAPKNEKKTGKKGDKDEEVSQEIKAGSYIKITQGIHNGLYGKVESRDDDNSSVFARLALGGKVVRVSLFAVYAVSAKEYERDGKCINKDDYEMEKLRIEKDRRKEEKRRDRDEGERKKERKERDREYERREEELWVRPDCRVRVISEEYKKGKYMDQKMRVVDVADRRNITLEDDDGRLHYNMRQSWLETVMPRSRGEKVVMVGGRYSGAKGVMMEKDKQREILHVTLLSSQEMIKVSFDDVCMWTPQLVEIDDGDL